MERTPEPGQILEGNARYYGYSMDLIHAIATKLNFTYKFEITKGHGKFTEGVGWDGPIKAILDNVRLIHTFHIRFFSIIAN